MDYYTLTTSHGTLYRHDDTDLICEDQDTCVSIGLIYGQCNIVIDTDEWNGFVAMINAIDARRKDQEVE